MNESDSRRSPLAAAACLSLPGFFFPLLKPMLRMSDQPAIGQQGFQGSGVARGNEHPTPPHWSWSSYWDFPRAVLEA